MLNNKISTSIFYFALVLMLLLAGSVKTWAHCDTMDGPVVADAKKALENKNVTLILKWVTKENEQEVKDAFNRTLAVRATGQEAKELADLYFFETLVRIHRAGEGAPYMGLKPAGSNVDSSVIASDKAIESGSVDNLADKISNLVATGIRERFEKVLRAKKQIDESVDAGREYVEAYIEFVHYVEKIHLEVLGAATHEGHSEK